MCEEVDTGSVAGRKKSSGNRFRGWVVRVSSINEVFQFTTLQGDIARASATGILKRKCELTFTSFYKKMAGKYFVLIYIFTDIFK